MINQGGARAKYRFILNRVGTRLQKIGQAYTFVFGIVLLLDWNGSTEWFDPPPIVPHPADSITAGFSRLDFFFVMSTLIIEIDPIPIEFESDRELLSRHTHC